MTAHDGLLAAILEHPEDDGLRLIFADRCDEADDHDRASFVRLQLAISSWGACPGAPHGPPGSVPTPGCVCEARRKLRRREHELLRLHGREWAEPLPTFFKQQRVGEFKISWRFARGFVESVKCDLLAWTGGKCPACKGSGGTGYGKFGACASCHGRGHTLGIGPAVVACQPVRAVVVSDREPVATVGGYAMWVLRNARRHGPEYLDEPLYDLLSGDEEKEGHWRWKEYDTRDLALAALSAALIAHARQA